MSTQDFLVELGTEELPPKALSDLSAAFRSGIESGLAEQQLAFETIQAFATPRRLAVLVTALQTQAEDQDVEVFGPPADRARDADGNWTGAAQGFARKHGVEPDQLAVAATEKGERLVFRSTKTGTRAADCLSDIITASISGLPIPKRMRWGAGREEFVRPVHWVLALLGSDVIDCEILGRRGSNTTRGHRFHSHGEITIEQPSNYQEVLREHRVIADFNERRELVRQQVEAQADSIGASAVISGDLLDEVTALVEWPVALLGSFEERFLEVPAEALVSSMKEHQKYFHLLDTDNKLLPNFITVSNIESRDPAQVIDGNERVIRPRLSDADFFFRSDQKTALDTRLEKLEKIVFQQKLGTVADKVRRIQALSAILCEITGARIDAAERAALLSKADLVTLMVGEFADMQGIAGRYYALNDGEDPAVADALQQQYWPRFAGDQLPDNPVATTLALADRLDTLVGIFGIGQPPTGSRDPFALRRASLGVLRILVEGGLELDLASALQAAADQYADGCLSETTVQDTLSYMIERFRAWYEDESIPGAVFNAVAARDLSVPVDIDRRVRAVDAFTRLPEATALAAANKRVSNILEKQASEIVLGEVSEGLLTDEAEKLLAASVGEQRQATQSLFEAGDYEAVLASLASLQEPVDRFFDEVMVMADDEAQRNNRLSLLRDLRNLFLQVADISQLAVAKA